MVQPKTSIFMILSEDLYVAGDLSWNWNLSSYLWGYESKTASIPNEQRVGVNSERTYAPKISRDVLKSR